MKLQTIIETFLCLLIFIFFIAIQYLLMALYECNLNAFYWKEHSRFIMTMLNFIAFIAMIAYLITKL